MNEFASLNLQMHTATEKAKLEARLTPDQSTAVNITNVNIVEKMTARGRVGIIIEMVIMNGVASAARGFCMRVGDNPDMA